MVGHNERLNFTSSNAFVKLSSVEARQRTMRRRGSAIIVVHCASNSSY
jgi:hypothetical protein